MITNRYYLGASGLQTNSLFFAGITPAPSPTGLTEGYDGTSFSTRPSMATARDGVGAVTAAPATLTFAIAGSPNSTATEEFTGETTSANIVNITTS